jgi:mutator protein MutT
MAANPDQRIVVVVAGVIERDGAFLVTRRMEGTHLAGYWEFPGGKCEEGEPHGACLRRELLEELGVDAVVHEQILALKHAYEDRTIALHFFRCDIDAEPVPRLGQAMRWVPRSELASLPFPPADTALIVRLSHG